jgi:hypothetical protein
MERAQAGGRRFIGSHWDVEWFDEESEADPQQELPVRWAV